MAFCQPEVNRADKKRTEREGGQVLITESNAQGSSGLYDLPFGSEMNISSPVKKSSVGANNSLQKMRNAFNGRVEIHNSTSKQMPWTDIAREYADGQVLSKKRNSQYFAGNH